MNFKEIKANTEKFIVSISQYHSYATTEFSIKKGKSFIYNRQNYYFDKYFDLYFNNFTIDVVAYDKDDKIIYQRNYELDSKIAKLAEQPTVIAIKKETSAFIENPKTLDLIDKIVAGDVKYGVDKSLDVAINLSKKDEEEKKQLALELKEKIVVTSKKEDIALAISKFTNEDPDELKLNNTQKDLYKMFESLIGKLIDGDINE